MNRHCVGPNAHQLAILVMRLLEDEVRAFGFDPVHALEIRELCKEGPGNMAKTPPCLPELQDDEQDYRGGGELQGATVCQG